MGGINITVGIGGVRGAVASFRTSTFPLSLYYLTLSTVLISFKTFQGDNYNVPITLLSC